jgi:hypothetical protein
MTVATKLAPSGAVLPILTSPAVGSEWSSMSLTPWRRSSKAAWLRLSKARPYSVSSTAWGFRSRAPPYHVRGAFQFSRLVPKRRRCDLTDRLSFTMNTHDEFGQCERVAVLRANLPR